MKHENIEKYHRERKKRDEQKEGAKEERWTECSCHVCHVEQRSVIVW